jgi:hypothetical protein
MQIMVEEWPLGEAPSLAKPTDSSMRASEEAGVVQAFLLKASSIRNAGLLPTMGTRVHMQPLLSIP